MIIAMIHFLEFFRAKAFYYLNKLINPVLNIFVPLILTYKTFAGVVKAAEGLPIKIKNEPFS
jgi:hypothetical protein